VRKPSSFAVIARSEATKQSSSYPGEAYGLLRFARNDVSKLLALNALWFRDQHRPQPAAPVLIHDFGPATAFPRQKRRARPVRMTTTA
jgi:hypothetical protein